MNKSENIAELAFALVLAQPMIETAKMDSVNPFFKSKYADLGAVWDAVREALKAQDLTVSQFPDQTVSGEPALTTILIHKSGQWISGTYPLCVTDKESTPQGYGSALTYARRYGLSAVLGVIADSDDDGNAASGRQKPTPKASEETPQAPQTPASKPTASAPTKTPEEWANMAIARIKGFKTRAEMDEFETKYHQKIAAIRLVVPDLHKQIISAIQAKNMEVA